MRMVACLVLIGQLLTAGCRVTSQSGARSAHTVPPDSSPGHQAVTHGGAFPPLRIAWQQDLPMYIAALVGSGDRLCALGTYYGLSQQNGVLAIDTKTGAVLWRVPRVPGLSSVAGSSAGFWVTEHLPGWDPDRPNSVVLRDKDTGNVLGSWTDPTSGDFIHSIASRPDGTCFAVAGRYGKDRGSDTVSAATLLELKPSATQIKVRTVRTLPHYGIWVQGRDIEDPLDTAFLPDDIGTFPDSPDWLFLAGDETQRVLTINLRTGETGLTGVLGEDYPGLMSWHSALIIALPRERRMVATSPDGRRLWQRPLINRRVWIRTEYGPGGGTLLSTPSRLIYVTGEVVYAIDPKTGSLLWKAKQPKSSWLHGEPVVVGSVLYEIIGPANVGQFGSIQAISITDGRRTWKSSPFRTQVYAMIGYAGALYLIERPAPGTSNGCILVKLVGTR